MRDDKRRRQTLKIELLSQWKLEAEFRNLIFKGHKNGLISSDLEAVLGCLDAWRRQPENWQIQVQYMALRQGSNNKS